MNGALLSSKKMDYCTPRDFFAELDREFHFTLDAAATEASAKCPAYYTPETDGLNSPWNIAGGVLYSATRRMAARPGSGYATPEVVRHINYEGGRGIPIEGMKP